MKTAYSYIRLSSKRQKTSGSGQNRQLEKFYALCKANDWQPSELTFQDLGVSGFKGKNRLEGALGEFITLAKQSKLGKHPILCLEGFDRFSRQDIDEAEPAFLDLLKSGVDIHVAFANKTFTKADTKDTIKRIEILVSIKQAHEFSAMLSSRMKSTQDARAKKIAGGQVVRTSNVPRYYAYDAKANTYHQTPAASVVKMIINDYLSGMSLYGISQKLNNDKVPCIGYKKGVRWSRMVIKGILKSKALYGYCQGNAKFFANPITDKATYDRIQVLMKQNAGNQGKFNGDYVNLFRGIGKCPCCGEGMSTGVHLYQSARKGKPKMLKKTPYRYLRCSSVSNSRPCTNRHNFNLRKIEEEFFAVFMQKDPETIFKPLEDKNQQAIAQLQAELLDVSKQVTALLDMKLDMPEVKAKLNALDKQRQAINAKITDLQMSQTAQVVRLDNIVNFKKLLADVKADIDNDKFNAGVELLYKKLQDNALRMRVRDMLPTFISRIDFDTNKNQWSVYDLNGKRIYTSMVA